MGSLASDGKGEDGGTGKGNSVGLAAALAGGGEALLDDTTDEARRVL